MNLERWIHVGIVLALVASAVLCFVAKRLGDRASREREAHDRKWRAIMWQIGESTRDRPGEPHARERGGHETRKRLS